MRPGENPFGSGMEKKGKALLCLLLVLSFFAFAGVASATTIFVPDDSENGSANRIVDGGCSGDAITLNADGRTLVVNQTDACTTGNLYFSTIQTAINAANVDDTIIVCPGTYNENVDVNKSVEIRSYSQNTSDTVVKASIALCIVDVGLVAHFSDGSTEDDFYEGWMGVGNFVNNKFTGSLDYGVGSDTITFTVDPKTLNIINFTATHSSSDPATGERFSKISGSNLSFSKSGNGWTTWCVGGKETGKCVSSFSFRFTDPYGNSKSVTSYEFNDNSYLSIRCNISLKAPSLAAFTYFPKEPLANEAVIFDASNSTDPDGGSIVKYTWNFGDGNITSTTNPVIRHTYTSAGDYVVTLTVEDDEGEINTTSKVISIKAYEPNLKAIYVSPTAVDLVWRKYNSSDFRKYEIYLHRGFGWIKLNEIYNSSETFYRDWTVGYNEEVWYKLRVNLSDGYVESDPIEVRTDSVYGTILRDVEWKPGVRYSVNGTVTVLANLDINGSRVDLYRGEGKIFSPEPKISAHNSTFNDIALIGAVKLVESKFSNSTVLVYGDIAGCVFNNSEVGASNATIYDSKFINTTTTADGSLTIRKSEFRKCDPALRFEYGENRKVVIENSSFYLNKNAIIIRNETESSFEIHHNNFCYNKFFAIKAEGNVGTTINATNNWWAHRDGPTNAKNAVKQGHLNWTLEQRGDLIAGVDKFSPWSTSGQLPSNAPKIDLVLKKVIVLQVVEGAKYLVAGKPTAVRALVDAKGEDVDTKVKLKMTKDGQTVWEETRKFKAKTSYSNIDIIGCKNSANFFNRKFPIASGSHLIEIRVDPDDKIEEIYEWNNYGPGIYGFQAGKPLWPKSILVKDYVKKKVLYIPLAISGYTPPDPFKFKRESDKWIKSLLPYSDTNYTSRVYSVSYTWFYPWSPFTIIRKPLFAIKVAWWELSKYLQNYNAKNPNDKADFAVGILNHSARKYYLGASKGMSVAGYRQCSIVDEQHPYTVVHELGHYYGLYTPRWYHWFTSWEFIRSRTTHWLFNYEQYDLYPPDGKILTNLTIYNKFNLPIRNYRIAKENLIFPISDLNLIDIMGRPDKQRGIIDAWIIPETYNDILSRVYSPNYDPSRIIVLSGTIKTFYDGKVMKRVIELDSGYVFTGEFDLEEEEIEPPYYTVHFKDANGNLLGKHDFKTIGLWDNNTYYELFVFTSEFPEGTRVVEFYNHTGHFIGFVTVSPNPPTVSILTPKGGNITKSFNITWTASDPDGDNLAFAIYYSNNNGQTWDLIALDVKDNNLAVDASQLPGGDDCLVKVVATDGFNTAEATSNPFTIPDKSPIVRIFTPSDAIIPSNVSWRFEGFAYDLEDGDLSNVTWYSSIDGILSHEKSFETVLSKGTHTITLSATDSAGHEVSKSVQLTVIDDQEAPKITRVFTIPSEPKSIGYFKLLAEISENAGASKMYVTARIVNFTIPIEMHSNGTYYEATLKAPNIGGIYVCEVTAIDAAGNIAVANASVTIKQVPLPVRNLNTGKSFEFIQDAIDDPDTKDGDTIIVDPGVYTGNIRIHKAITLKSKGNDAIIKWGKHVFDVTSSNVTISGFTITGGEVGIRLCGVKHCNISNNRIVENFKGIELNCSSNNVISDNLIINNGIGLYALYSDSNRVSSNTFSDNYKGVSLLSSDTNVVYLNNFVNNTVQVGSFDAINIWNSTMPINYTYNSNTYTNYLGNYWSDYKGSDADEDGIGDTPYIIDGDKDKYPLIKRFENYFVPTQVQTFDTGRPENPYPSISGKFIGTIKTNTKIIAKKLYTYACEGTGGHTEYALIWNKTWCAYAEWDGYKGDWMNISFNRTVVLMPHETYNITIVTGSYPQIHHTSSLKTENGWINCTEFIDANGKKYDDWIPAIMLWS